MGDFGRGLGKEEGEMKNTGKMIKNKESVPIKPLVFILYSSQGGQSLKERVFFKILFISGGSVG